MGCSHMQPDGIHCNTPPHLSSISIIGSRVCQWLPHISPTFISSSLFVCIIISFRPAWLARALLSFKRAQSSGNDDVDEGQHAPFDVRGSKIHHVFPQTLTKSSVIRDESAPYGCICVRSAKSPNETPPNCQTKMRQTTKRLLLHAGCKLC